MTAGQRFEAIVRELGYSQKEMAERLGVTQQSISLYIQGKRPISKLLALALAYTDGVNPEWLLSGEAPKFKKLKK
jgi:transcriptional regulator with XRE-family HTH domain